MTIFYSILFYFALSCLAMFQMICIHLPSPCDRPEVQVGHPHHVQLTQCQLRLAWPVQFRFIRFWEDQYFSYDLINFVVGRPLRIMTLIMNFKLLWSLTCEYHQSRAPVRGTLMPPSWCTSPRWCHCPPLTREGSTLSAVSSPARSPLVWRPES